MAQKSIPNLLVDKISALTRGQRIAVCIVTFLLLGGFFFYLIYIPKSDKVKELKESYNDLQVKLTKARAAARMLEKYEKKYQEAQGEFRLVLQLLPDKKEIPTLLENISSSGRRSGLEFLLFQPGEEIAKGFYTEIPVKMNVEGGYHNLAIFFDKVARLSRIVNVSDISIKAAKAKGHLKASCVGTTYRFVEDSGKKPTNAKKG